MGLPFSYLFLAHSVNTDMASNQHLKVFVASALSKFLRPGCGFIVTKEDGPLVLYLQPGCMMLQGVCFHVTPGKGLVGPFLVSDLG